MPRLQSKILFLLLATFVAMSPISRAARANAPSGEEVLRSLGRADLIGDPALSVQVKPWKNLAGSFVALVYMSAGEVVRTRRLRPTLAVLKTAEGQLSVVAKAEISDGRCRELPDGVIELQPNEDGSDCSEIRLDLASYRISPSETAVGLRTTIHQASGTGESESVFLTLYQIAGEALRPIFSHEIESSDEQRGPTEPSKSASTLQVTKHQTLGHFDLLIVETVSTEPPADRNDGFDTPPTDRTERHRFVWQGQSYAEAK